MAHVCIWGDAAWEIYGAIALFLCTLAMPFFPFFVGARWGVVNGTQHEPLQWRLVHPLRASSCLSSHAESSSGAVTRSARLPGWRPRRPSPVSRCSTNLSLTLYWERIPCTLWFCGEPDRCCCFGPKAPTLPGISPSVLRTWTRWDTAITF